MKTTVISDDAQSTVLSTPLLGYEVRCTIGSAHFSIEVFAEAGAGQLVRFMDTYDLIELLDPTKILVERTRLGIATEPVDASILPNTVLIVGDLIHIHLDTAEIFLVHNGVAIGHCNWLAVLPSEERKEQLYHAAKRYSEVRGQR